jgi:hypothetical protein
MFKTYISGASISEQEKFLAHFDPIKKRESYLRDDRLLLRFNLDTKYDSERPMGNVANSEIQSVISASLSGLHGEMAPIIPRAVD